MIKKKSLKTQHEVEEGDVEEGEVEEGKGGGGEGRRRRRVKKKKADVLSIMTKVIKQMTTKWAVPVARMGVNRKEHRVLAGKSKRKRPLERGRCRE